MTDPTSPFAGIGVVPTGVQQSTDPRVFWGYTGQVTNPALIDIGAPARESATKSTDEALGYIAWSRGRNPQEYESIRQRMIASGAIAPDAGFSEVQSAWSKAVGFSVDAGLNGYQITPFDSIDLIGDPNGAGGQGARNGTYTTAINRTSTTRDTNRSVNLSSASEARAFLLAAAERELGRAATSDEIAAFRRALNAEEKANPETTVTTGKSTTTGSQSTTYVDGEATASNDNTNTTSSSDSTTTGGMDRGQYAIDYARSADDYAEFQAATTFMNTLFATLGSPVNVGTN